MDFLFDNPLANLYGPYFLIFYVFFIICTIIGYRVLRARIDKTALYAIPPIPVNPDPFEIAYLRGGANELARAVVFSLNQKNLLQFTNDEKTSHILPTEIEFEKRDLKPIERTALEWFGTTRETKELFAQTDGLAAALKPYCDTFQSRLEMQNFLPGAEITRRNNRLALKAFLIFGGLGAYKIVAAILGGYWNVIGIVVITIVGLFVLGIAARMPRLTMLGKAYLERLQLAFERIKPSNHNPLSVQQAPVPSATFAAVDPFLLSVGVFGGAALAETIYSDYNRAFERAHNQSATGSGGCGSSCGSSSCSSGGDGGGCGGCGGGD
jgi:uncharacterized protein (TIGR04222 family)